MKVSYYLDLYKDNKAWNRKAVEEGYLCFYSENNVPSLMEGQERLKIVLDLPDRYFNESFVTAIVPESIELTSERTLED